MKELSDNEMLSRLLECDKPGEGNAVSDRSSATIRVLDRWKLCSLIGQPSAATDAWQRPDWPARIAFEAGQCFWPNHGNEPSDSQTGF